jgi:uncharacterized protein YlaI
MGATIAIAKDLITERLLHISEVDKSSMKDFVCCDCHQRLVPVKTERRGKDWHFRHPPDSDIIKCRSTALHDYAIQILVENSNIFIKKNQSINYGETRKEVSINNKYRSDVTVRFGNEDLHFEVFVTHDLDSIKTEEYQNNKIKCIKIDLSSPQLLSAQPNEIEDEVLKNYNNKKIIYWDENIASKENSNLFNSVLLFFGTLTAIFLLKRFYKKRKR